MKVRAYNPPTDGLEKSFLSTAVSAGTATLTIRNNDRFVANAKVMVGEMGHERTEIATISTTPAAGTLLNLTTNLVFDHDADTPIYVLKYDYARFYRATDGITGNFTQLAQVLIDVDNLEKMTVYDDVNGLSTYYYKLSFFSSVDNSETALSDPIAGSGYPRGTVGSLINEVFEEVADSRQQNMTVAEMIGLINEANDDIVSQSRRPYRFLKTSAPLNISGGNSRVAMPANLWKFDRLAFTDAANQRVDTYARISINEMEEYRFDNTAQTSDDLLYVSIDETTNEIILYPTPKTSSTGGIKLWYWKKFDEVIGMADKFVTPNQRIYKLFIMGRYYRKRSIKEPSFLNLSDRFLSDYNTEIVKLQRYNRLDMGTPMSQKPDTGTQNGLRRV